MQTAQGGELLVERSCAKGREHGKRLVEENRRRETTYYIIIAKKAYACVCIYIEALFRSPGGSVRTRRGKNSDSKGPADTELRW